MMSYPVRDMPSGTKGLNPRAPPFVSSFASAHFSPVQSPPSPQHSGSLTSFSLKQALAASTSPPCTPEASESLTHISGTSTPTTSSDSDRGDSPGGTWCPRFSFTSIDGCIVVKTPWYPHGVAKETLQLGEEIMDFAQFMQLTEAERNLRVTVRCTLQEIVRKLWPDATVKCHGSFSYGTSLPDSPLDLTCENCGDLTPLCDAIHAMAPRLEVLEHTACGEAAFMKLKAGEVVATVVFTQGTSNARRAAAVTKKFLTEFPVAGQVSMVVRTVLSQMRYNDVSNGGLSSYSVLMMVFHICQKCPPGSDAGVILKEFYATFASFNFAAYTISPFHSEPLPRNPAHHGDVSVMDPVDPDNNLAVDCHRIGPITQHFQYVSMALRKWDGAPTTTGAKRGYKGRTPLALIVPLQPLWKRTQLLTEPHTL